jgi:signal transduction histidine kinase/CheY-like chemotaxis protein
MTAWLRDAPIRRKLIVLGLLASACAVVTASVVFLVTTYVVARRVIHTNIVAQAAITADNVTAAVAFGDRAAATDTLHALRAAPGIDVACVWDAQRRLFATYQRIAQVSCPDAEVEDVDRIAAQYVEVARSVVVGGRRVGGLYIRGNLNEVVTRVEIQGIAALGALLLGTLVALVFATRFQRIITGPLTRLASTASEISRRGDYTIRATQAPGRDELGQLVVAFNEMLGQIEHRDEEVRAAGRVKDEFLAVLSHELRTPLNAILGWSRLMSERDRRDEALIDRGLDAITRNAQLQTQLIADLLDVSQIITGKFSVHFRQVDVRTVIAAAIDSVRPSAENKNISIDVTVDAASTVVSGDAERLQQVVWNLLSNAIKFTAKGGRIDIQLRGVDSELELRVIDSGMGIDPQFLPHVFERFRQADSSKTRAHGGLGLGLAIARHLTEAHGGTVSAYSEGTGTGSTFIVRLPIPAPTTVVAAERRQRPSLAVSLEDLRVLVVDDEADSREVVTLTLQGAGADVTALESAAEAVTSLMSHRFHALVADIGMPVHDGYWLIQKVRSLPNDGRGRIPAIALTAYASAQDQRDALQAGFDRHLAKPVDPDDLCAAVAAVVGRMVS